MIFSNPAFYLLVTLAKQGSQLHRIQKTTENIPISDVTFLIIAPYKYSYLLTYLLTYYSSFCT